MALWLRVSVVTESGTIGVRKLAFAPSNSTTAVPAVEDPTVGGAAGLSCLEETLAVLPGGVACWVLHGRDAHALNFRSTPL